MHVEKNELNDLVSLFLRKNLSIKADVKKTYDGGNGSSGLMFTSYVEISLILEGDIISTSSIDI